MGTLRQKVPEVDARRIVDIRSIARRLISASYPTLLRKPGPFPVHDFFDIKMRTLIGFNGHVQELPEGIEAATDPLLKLITVDVETYDLLCADVGRARFTVCHEFGHACMHATSLRELLISGRRVARFNRGDIPPWRDPEWQADTFAAELLMPEWHMRPLIAEGADKRDVMATFKVSRQAAEIRLEKLAK